MNRIRGFNTDDDWDVSNDEPVDEDTAMSVIDSYTENYVKLVGCQ